MLNDTALTALLNLFALTCARSKSSVERCTALIDSYLGTHFGLRNKQSYVEMFVDFADLHSMENGIDAKDVIEPICAGLRGTVEGTELKLLLLRLMEFCKQTTPKFSADDKLLTMIARSMGVSESDYTQFADFVEEHPEGQVRVQRFDGYDGKLCTLWMENERRLVFSYEGADEVTLDDVPVMRGIFQVWHESGVLKNHKGAPLYHATMLQAYESAQRDLVTFAGRDINFRFPNSDNGMHDFCFTLHGGELVAIMGGSGTGKTTLLSLLTGALKPQTGRITINGHDIDEEAAKRLIGFVPQDDLLVEELTVYQNLYYTARLCFDGLSEEDIDRRVSDVLHALDLERISHLKVGGALNKTISGGQRKRLNIALELIREPAVLMLDEPTSGLSSTDTEHVVGLLKQQTYKGRLVIVNIHQPSSDVYKLFDRLWLLDKGGYPVFDGNPIEAITYFKTAANRADADTSTCPTCGNLNPEILLNIIDEKMVDSSGHLSDERQTTPQQWHEMYLANRDEMAEPVRTDIPTTAQQQPGRWKQFVIQLQRNIKTKATNIQYVLITLLEAPVMALICGWLTRYAPESGYTVADNKNFVSFLFMAVVVCTFIGMSGSAEEIIRDRALLKRERFLHLSYGSYISSKIALLAAVSLVQTLLFTLIGQWVIGFHDLTGTWWLILFITTLVANLTGLLLSQCMSSVVAIYITIPLLLIPQILLCGLVVDFSDLNGKSTTNNVPLIGEVIPSRWAYEALAVTTFADNAYEKPLFEFHRQQYQDQYTQNVLLYEMDSQLETLQHEQTMGDSVQQRHMDIIKTELPRLSMLSDIESYDGDYSYASLKAYFKTADKALMRRSNRATLSADSVICAMMNEMGHEEFTKMRSAHANRQLESVVTGSTYPETHVITRNHIVPRMGQIYLTPVTHDGRAPFYSFYKQVGSVKVKTLWFNLGVLALMAVILMVLIYSDRPGRWVRKQ